MQLNHAPDRNILVITKGHPFDRQAFFGMLDAVLSPDGPFAPGAVQWTHVEHPAAVALLNPSAVAQFAAILFYDMPGLDFRPGGLFFVDPPPELKAGLSALTDAGMPLFFLHHAVAGWPAWDGYAELVGARFHYRAGAGRLDSGYRHEVMHKIRPVVEHAVTAGLEGGFTITDECYLLAVDETDKLPLLRSDHAFFRDGFYSAAAAVAGRLYANDGWEHPPGSDLIAWAKRSGNSPVLYFQCGDGPTAYENAGFRRVIRNGIDWLTSGAARDWALSRS